MDTDLFNIKHEKVIPKQGLVLISEPFSRDSYFKRSIVFLTEYNKKGSVGFILNKQIDVQLSEIIGEVYDFNATISIGGPVNTDRIYYIHTLGNQIPNSVKITGNIYWGGDFEVLKNLINASCINSNEILFFIGYSGWSPNQLDTEISKNYWLVSNISSDEIMNKNNNIWKKTIEKLGVKYKSWKNIPEDPQLN